MKLLVKSPFIRLFVKRAEAEALIKGLMALHGAKIDFQFEHEPSQSIVFAVSSPAGRFSVVATDQTQPEFIAKTRCVYIVESIDDTLAEAVAAGMTVAQPKQPVPTVGFQARIKISEDNFIEIAEWTAQYIAKNREAGFSFD